MCGGGGSQTGSELTLINVGGRISEKILENAESRIRDRRMLWGEGGNSGFKLTLIQRRKGTGNSEKGQISTGSSEH